MKNPAIVALVIGALALSKVIWADMQFAPAWDGWVPVDSILFPGNTKVLFPKFKLTFGLDGSYTDVSTTNPFPVTVASFPPITVSPVPTQSVYVVGPSPLPVSIPSFPPIVISPIPLPVVFASPSPTLSVSVLNPDTNYALEAGGHLESIDSKITTTVNGIKVDGSAVTQPVSGTFFQSVQPVSQSGTWTVQQGTPPWSVSQSGAWSVTSNIGTTGGLQLDTTGAQLNNAQSSTTSGQTGPLVQGAVTTAAPTYTTGKTDPLSLTTAGALRTDSSATTQPISGSVSVSNFPATQAVTQSTSPWVDNITQFGGNNVVTGTGASGSGIPRVTVSNDSNVLATQSGAWTVTANAGTNLNTSALALDTTVSGLQVSQGSTTSGQKGGLALGAVTTAAPTYTTAQTSPLSLTLAGALRTDSSGTTQPISGTVTANQGTSPWVNNVSQFGGNNVVTGTGTSGLGIPRVTVSNDSNVLATQSGTWTTGRTWTLLNTTDSVNAVQSGTWTVQQGTPPWSVSQSGSWDIRNITGTVSLPTNAAQETGGNLDDIDANTDALNLAQGSTTSGQNGPLIQAATTTAAPTYTTAKTNPLSTSTAGGLRSDITQFGDTNLSTGTGAGGAGIPRVTVSNDSNILATQSGTWTVQQGTPPWSVSQSGTWTTGRTWTLSASTDSINVSQFGGSAIVTGTGASGSGIPRVTVSNDSKVQVWDGTNTQAVKAASTAAAAADPSAVVALSPNSPIPTGSNVIGALVANQSVNVAQVAGTNTVTAGVSGLQAIGGNAASAASDSGNPVKTGAVFNSTLPSVTTGQRVDAQADSNGRHIVANAPLDGSKATYRYASAAAFAPAASATDICAITGSATKTIRLWRVYVSGTQTTSSEVNLFLVRRSTANTGGTSTSLVATTNDTNNAAATATAVQYTANPTAGTLVGTILAAKILVPVVAVGGNAVQGPFQEIPFGDRGVQTEVLRGTSQVIAVNLGGVTVTGGSFLCTFEITEE